MTALTDLDRRVVAETRGLAALRGPVAICEHTGAPDMDTAYAYALGQAQHMLGELAAIIDRLAAEPRGSADQDPH